MIKFYLKVFFINFVLMAVFVFLFSVLRKDAAPEGLTAVYIGAAFGLFMALAAGTLHVVMVKKRAGRTVLSDPYSTAQELELNVSMPYEKLFDLCRRYAAENARYAVSEADQTKGLISARTPWSWKGYGNIFAIKFSDIKDGSATVRISSRPRLPSVLLDYGDNLANVLRARDYIQTNAH